MRLLKWKLAFGWVLLLLLVAGSFGVHKFQKIDERVDSLIIDNLAKDKSIKTLNQTILTCQKDKTDVEQDLKSAIADFNLQEARRIAQIDTLLTNQDYLVERIAELQEQREVLQGIVDGGQVGSQGSVEELIAEINRLDSILLARTKERETLTENIALLEYKKRQARQHIDDVIGLVFDVQNTIFSIIDHSDNVEAQELIAAASQNDYPLVDGTQYSLELLLQDVEMTRERLDAAEERIRLYETDTSFLSSIGNESIIATIQNLKSQLVKRTEQLREAKEKLDKRYILVASTDELVEWGVLVPRGKRGKKKKQFDFDLSKIQIEDCQILSRMQKSIIIPYGRENIIDVETPHDNQSYVIRSSVEDPTRSELFIMDNAAFWQFSRFLVIQTKS